VSPAPAELRDQALANYRALSGLGSLRGHGDADLEDPQVSFQVAQGVPDVDFLSAMLRERSEIGRLRQFNRYVAEYLPRQRTVERMKELAPTNGHGHKPAGL